MATSVANYSDGRDEHDNAEIEDATTPEDDHTHAQSGEGEIEETTTAEGDHRHVQSGEAKIEDATTLNDHRHAQSGQAKIEDATAATPATTGEADIEATTTEDNHRHAVSGEAGDGGLDNVDGFLKSKTGRYFPRGEEIKTWGHAVVKGGFVGEEDPDDFIFQLLKTTAPETRWRSGLVSLLQMYFTEDACRGAMDFLLSNGEEGIKASEKGFDEHVHIEEMTPNPINCGDWMIIMEGLNFDLTSPMTVRDIHYVDVSVGKKTDTGALKGFCYLLECLRGLRWSSIQGLLNLGEMDGALLYDTVELSGAGSGIKEISRSQLDTLYTKHKGLMKELGFQKGGNKHVLQWQNPRNSEFSRTFAVVKGLYRPANKLETTM